MIYRAFLILSLVITTNLASAAAAPKELILIKTSRLIDARTGKLLTDQAILFDGNKIESLSLRHAVWNAEKTGCIPREIAEKRHNSADFALKPGLEKASYSTLKASFVARFSEAATGSPVSVNPLGECNPITSR